MGKRMASAAFTFLPFGKENYTESQSTSRRRLADANASTAEQPQAHGMERYAQLIGVQVNYLFYVTLAGVLASLASVLVLYALLVCVCGAFVADFGAFARKWWDKAVGVLLLIAIVSEYAVGVTATFQFCWSMDQNQVDAGLFLSIGVLLFLALGTILFGVVVIKNNEHQLRDLGTKDHLEKPIYARYGPLYDEYKYENRFFFAPKLLLALLCGMTTGMIWLPGLYQLLVLLALHIAFLFLLEYKQPFAAQFVQRASSLVVFIKISALFLSCFLLASASSASSVIPVDLREAVGFVIVGLQVLVLVCLMVRQVYIFVRTYKLKRQEKDAEEAQQQQQQLAATSTSSNRDAGRDAGGADSFFAMAEGTSSLTPMLAEQTDTRFKRPHLGPAPRKPQGKYQYNTSSRHQDVDL